MQHLKYAVIVMLLLIACPVAHVLHAHERKIDDPETESLGLMLTWQQDPTTTMTIDRHTENHGGQAVIEYRKAGSESWYYQVGEVQPFPFSDRIINRFELTDLEPGTRYRFRFAGDTEYRYFQTMPEDAWRPIRFATGGDVRHSREMMERTTRQAVSYNPDFIVWGGDLAYADGREDRLYRWYEYLEVMMQTLITEDGRVIPVLAAPGNHEVLGGRYNNDDHEMRQDVPEYRYDDESRRQIAPYYYGLLAFPGQPGYGVLDFGDYMSILLLDTGHSNPIEGEQTEWLEGVLAERKGIPHIFPSYHIPAWPSVRRESGTNSTRVRENWVPLFEEAGVRVALENHDHAYKRTFPMLGDQFDPNGIVYIGDGAWGVGTRPISGSDDPEHWTYHEENPWYLKRAASVRHFIIATIHGPHQHFLMVDEDGHVIDEYPKTPHMDVDRSQQAEPWENRERN